MEIRIFQQSFGSHLPDESFVHINVNFLSLVSKFFQLEWLTMFSDMNKAKNNIIRKKVEMKLRFFLKNLFTSIFTVVTTLNSVVQKLISSNQWLNFNPFFFLLFKSIL